MKQVNDVPLRVIATVLGVIVLAAVIIAVFRYQPQRAMLGSLPASGPRVAIPIVAEATLVQGHHVYEREGCDRCHTMTGTGMGAIPDLKHEGQRNADIDWQMTNLRHHRKIHPNSDMPNYDKLSPGDLRALASYLATRK